MGQYYLVVNVDKQQYIDPHRCGDGAKLLEFASTGCGMMACLAILLADGNGRGGGDLRSEDPIIGSWAGDRIVISGDYSDEGKFVEGKFVEGADSLNLYNFAQENFEDISDAVIVALCDDHYAGEEIREKYKGYDFTGDGLPTRETLAARKAARAAENVLYALGKKGLPVPDSYNERDAYEKLLKKVAKLFVDTGDWKADTALLAQNAAFKLGAAAVG